jgi:hypothetical protein
MTSETTLIWMENAITIEEDQLGPTLWVGVFEFFEKLEEGGDLSECEKSRDVWLTYGYNLIVFIHYFIFFDIVDNEASTGNFRFIFIGTEINSTD